MKTRIFFVFADNICHFILSSLSLHFSQIKTKENAPKKRSRLQRPMKLTSSPHEAYFIAQ